MKFGAAFAFLLLFSGSAWAQATQPIVVIAPSLTKIAWTNDPRAATYQEATVKAGINPVTFTNVADAVRSGEEWTKPLPTSMTDGEWIYNLRGVSSAGVTLGAGPIASLWIKVQTIQIPGLPALRLIMPSAVPPPE